MDFLVSWHWPLAHYRVSLLENRTSRSNQTVVEHFAGPIQYFLSGASAAITRTEGGIDFFDGHGTAGRQHYHARFGDAQATRFVESVRADPIKAATGVYAIGQIRTSRTGQHLRVIPDACGNYPVFLHASARGAVVSNNLLMIEAVTGAQRNAWQGVSNLTSRGGLWRDTQLDGVERLELGHGLDLCAAGGLTRFTFDPHQPADRPYRDVLQESHDSITAHLGAVFRAHPLAEYICDLTGGGDSRALIAFLEAQPGLAYRTRTMGRYPNPDANVAGLLLHMLGRSPARMPVPAVSPQVTVRQNAVLSAGAREAGTIVNPAGIADVVHFSGVFGEVAGNPGPNFLRDALDANPKAGLTDGLDRLFDRQRRIGALGFVTRDAREEVRKAELAIYAELAARGYDDSALLAERFLRIKAHSHFGLHSVITNRNFICPDLLANRHLIDARRLTKPQLEESKKVIFDLIELSDMPRLLFAPMANKPWPPEIVPPHLRARAEAVLNVDEATANLSDRDGPLYEKLSFAQDAFGRADMLDLPLRKMPETAAKHPQFLHQETNRAFLQFFIENLSPDHEVWRQFDRTAVQTAALHDPMAAANPAQKIVAMSIVASTLCWVAGLEMVPQTRETTDIATISEASRHHR